MKFKIYYVIVGLKKKIVLDLIDGQVQLQYVSVPLFHTINDYDFN